MGTDPWGIDSGYEDTSHHWHATSAETREAILAAMGVTIREAPRPDRDPVRVVASGRRTRWAEPGTLHLEDGTSLPVRDHLPPDLPCGYHEFRAALGDVAQRVIVAPKDCLLPEPGWGWSVQLYAARSRASWGIGDLADLRRIGQWAKGLGAAMLLVNPLAAGAPVVPQEPSPYFPTSRRFLNPLYLRVEEAPGAAELGPLLDRLAAAGRALGDRRLIDRDEVFRLKDQALRTLWAGFPGSDAFEAYCRERSPELETFATWCALAAAHQRGDWRTWPAEHQRPDTPAVRRFAREHAGEVRYHQWLQWLLDMQLAQAARATKLVHDLPIGVDPGGADAWAWQDILADGCTVGAPPDLFNPAGQDWNLPPMVPHKLRAAGYGPFVQTIRAALRHAGGLRIDHVMGLFRLYWIPRGFGPTRGAYVRYRADELLAIVALESRRAGAFVVGEDLGTVEPAVRRELRKRRMLSFRVLWFEK
ncbi:MAG: 4-alpha-glucanotransferase, partial [Thermoguttaceae bacterium]|nr:4-alpha-glucanotransferase [Thermoguttaceae bacterium]